MALDRLMLIVSIQCNTIRMIPHHLLYRRRQLNNEDERDVLFLWRAPGWDTRKNRCRLVQSRLPGKPTQRLVYPWSTPGLVQRLDSSPDARLLEGAVIGQHADSAVVGQRAV